MLFEGSPGSESPQCRPTPSVAMLPKYNAARTKSAVRRSVIRSTAARRLQDSEFREAEDKENCRATSPVQEAEDKENCRATSLLPGHPMVLAKEDTGYCLSYNAKRTKRFVRQSRVARKLQFHAGGEPGFDSQLNALGHFPVSPGPGPNASLLQDVSSDAVSPVLEKLELFYLHRLGDV